MNFWLRQKLKEFVCQSGTKCFLFIFQDQNQRFLLSWRHTSSSQSSQYIFVPLSVSTCVMRAPGVMSVTNITSLCHAVFVTGVCPQLVVIAPSHSVSQHRHRSPEPAEKIALDCDTGPRSTLHMAKCETGNPSLDLGSSRVIRAPQCRANMCYYQQISMIIKCFMWSLDE